MNQSTLQAKNISKQYLQAKAPLPVLKNISVSFEQGKTYAITGVSGSGKSTLLHIMGGLDAPNSGDVFFDEQNFYKLRARAKEKLLNSSVGFVFQFHYLINELTVLENIYLVGLIRGEKKPIAIERAKKLLDHVGLLDKAEQHPFQLSGGEQQRVSILRAIFNKPKFLLADEPTGNLDADNAQLIVDFLLECQKEWNMGLIICSHDKAVYERMETVLELKGGSLGIQKQPKT
ncbi:ABC transporter ATP-binding protein [Candidatus Babeliales bacterium]|nr:ABC transporter ATP-binding protein [Candidatus Babeliales bacterium]